MKIAINKNFDSNTKFTEKELHANGLTLLVPRTDVLGLLESAV